MGRPVYSGKLIHTGLSGTRTIYVCCAFQEFEEMPSPGRMVAQSLSIACKASQVFPSELRYPASTGRPAPPLELFWQPSAGAKQSLSDRYRFERGQAVLDVHTWTVTYERDGSHRVFLFVLAENS